LSVSRLGVITEPVVACEVLAGVGVGVVVFEVLSITLVQRLRRLALPGRAFGIENMAVDGGKLAGALLVAAREPVVQALTRLSLFDGASEPALECHGPPR
jgi:hypothetical protein